MIRPAARPWLALGLLLSASLLSAAAEPPVALGRIVVRNDSAIARQGEVVEVGLAALGPMWWMLRAGTSSCSQWT